LVLGSGGARGVAHLGALKVLEENNIKPDIVVGCSMGSLVGGLYCTGHNLDELRDLLGQLTKKDIIDVSINMIKNRALLKSDKTDKFLRGFFQDKKIEDCEIPFGTVSVDLISGKEIYFTKGDFFTAVRASCSIPTIIKPVQYENMLLVDGGLINRVPTEFARNMGADKVIAVDVMHGVGQKRQINNIFDVALRSIDVVDYYITKNRLESSPPDVLVLPKLKDMSPYKVEDLEFAYEQGYNAMQANLKRIKALVNEL